MSKNSKKIYPHIERSPHSSFEYSVRPPIPPEKSAWPRIFFVLMILIVFFGTISTAVSYKRTVERTKKEFLSYAQALAVGVADHDVSLLRGVKTEVGTEAYERVKTRLIKMRATNPFFRFMYFMGFREGTWFFYADSEPSSSPDISLPGDVYHEPTQKKLWDENTQTAFIYGPYTDVWGRWVSAFVPLVDENGVKRFFGVDINASVWTWTLLQSASMPVGFSLCILLAVIFLYFSDRQHRHFRERIYHEQYELWRQHERLDLAVRASRDGIFDIVVNTGEAYYSERFLAILGRTQERVRLAPLFSEFLRLIHPDDYDAFVEKIQLHLISGEPFNIDFRMKHRTGEFMWVSGRGSAYVNEYGKPWRFIGFITDITEQKIVENMRNEFVTITSHQLRTPLTAIKWFCSILANGDVGDLTHDQASCLREIVESNERMIQLVNDLLLVSRIERNIPLVLDKDPVDISKIVHECVQEFSTLIEKNTVHIAVSSPEEQPLFIKADLVKIKEAIRKLLHNAIVYSFTQGTIDVVVKRIDTEVAISFRDRGIGIALKEQKHLFEKFFRGDEARLKEPGGNGLGLFIVKSYIEAHKGKISFTSRAKRGSTFTVILPLVRK